MGATAGRTTLQGEGLQHCDGHSLLFATAIPNIRAFDPAFAYEMAVIVRDGMTRMYGADPEDLIYYLTLYNEAFPQPPMPAGVDEGIRAGLYRCRDAPADRTHAGRILASGTAMLAALEAQQMLSDHHDVGVEVWSATSYKALATMRCPSNVGTVPPPPPPPPPCGARVLIGGAIASLALSVCDGVRSQYFYWLLEVS